MKITIDTDAQSLVCQAGDETPTRLPLYSSEAFRVVSQVWLRQEWNLLHWQSFSWLGFQLWQLPEDVLRLQEVIASVRPDVIIETGVNRGGSAVFFASDEMARATKMHADLMQVQALQPPIPVLKYVPVNQGVLKTLCDKVAKTYKGITLTSNADGDIVACFSENLELTVVGSPAADSFTLLPDARGSGYFSVAPNGGNDVVDATAAPDGDITVTSATDSGDDTYYLNGVPETMADGPGFDRISLERATHGIKMFDNGGLTAGAEVFVGTRFDDQIRGAKIMKGKGCNTCNNTGYKGRVALYEVMPFVDPLKELVLQGASAAEIKAEMIRQGVQSLRMAGIQKILEGMTTPEEVLRTTVDD